MPIELHQIPGYSLAKMPADVETELNLFLHYPHKTSTVYGEGSATKTI